jgi:hypothetical protein
MRVKLRKEFSFFIAETCFKAEIIESNLYNGRWYFKTNDHFFVYDRNDNLNDDEFDIIELNIFELLSYDANNSFSKIEDFFEKLDNSKKYFQFWYYGEAMHSNNRIWERLMEVGVDIYSSTWIKEFVKYPTYHYSMDFAFHYFNHFNGLCYVYTDNLVRGNFRKDYKVGMYGVTSSKLENEDRHWRNNYIDYFASKNDSLILSYKTKGLFQLSQLYRNQHFALPFDFANANYFITAETHFNSRHSDPLAPKFFDLPYFTSEKIMKAAFMEIFNTNTILITSPMHIKELHENGFVFANSKFITEYTPECVMDSIFECYNSTEIIETNNLELVKKILNKNLFIDYKII